jgi:hypothetical protein
MLPYFHGDLPGGCVLEIGLLTTTRLSFVLDLRSILWFNGIMANEVGGVLGFFGLLAIVIGFFFMVGQSLKKSQNDADRRYSNDRGGGLF